MKVSDYLMGKIADAGIDKVFYEVRVDDDKPSKKISFVQKGALK